MTSKDVNYEQLPAGAEMDETDVNLRSYFSRLSDKHLSEFDPAWSDEEVMKWDDNFTCEGELMLICSERDVDVAEYRRVLEEHMKLRGLWPPKAAKSE